jgi:hypothetical protein
LCIHIGAGLDKVLDDVKSVRGRGAVKRCVPEWVGCVQRQPFRKQRLYGTEVTAVGGSMQSIIEWRVPSGDVTETHNLK